MRNEEGIEQVAVIGERHHGQLALIARRALIRSRKTGEQIEEIVTELASTPAHHAALAAHYSAKAKEARSEAVRHELMRRGYRGGKQRSGPAGSHCKRIADNYRAMAAEYDELAALHAEQAK